MREPIEIGHQTFVADGSDPFGAVRAVAPDGRDEIVVYVENAGDFTVPLRAVQSVHFRKVILDPLQLDPALRDAIARAHDAEEPGL